MRSDLLTYALMGQRCWEGSEVWLALWYDGIPSFGTDSSNGEVFIFHWSLQPYVQLLFLHFSIGSLYQCLSSSTSPLQIQKVILSLGDYMHAGCHACIGGTNVRSEIMKLSSGAPHIVVGTPGRVFDMLCRGHLCEYRAKPWVILSRFPTWNLTVDFPAGSKNIKMFVLDEADEMLSRGFKDQIYEIFQKLPANIQVSVVAYKCVTLPNLNRILDLTLLLC